MSTQYFIVITSLVLLFALFVLSLPNHARSENITLDQIIARNSDDQLITMWTKANIKCQADTSGEVIPACLVRTDIANELRERGWCENEITTTSHFNKCLVQ
jgi:hypothetical protein